MNGYYAIAIDGPSGAGKSSMAKRLAAAFGFLYVDTGAIYRTLGLACFQAGIDRKDEDAVMKVLPTLDISLRYNEQGEQCMFLNRTDVSREIRLPEISVCASEVSAHQRVRSFLLDMQRKFARENNVIMDGRDIGTVVLPDAELKIFLTASPEARARRRYAELKEKGSDVGFDEVLRDMIERDEKDSSRAAAPLRKAEDAVEVDSSELNREETFALLC
jgi:cytidylate kinase